MTATSQTAWAAHPWVEEARKEIRFGIAYGPQLEQPFDWSALIDFVQAAEDLGFDSYWTSDHPLRFPDCWATLMPLALKTRRIRLGPLVSCVYYRDPALMARLGADVDHISNGRLILGIGNGDHSGEFEQLGLAFPPPRERQAALAEALQIIQGLWSGAPVTLHGLHFQAREAMLVAGPVQRPRVPILIAGGGERYTLRQVAEFADMCNFGPHAAVGSAFTIGDVERKLAALDAHCADLGRAPDTVLRSHWSAPVVVAPTPQAVQAKLERIAPWVERFQSRFAGQPHEVVAAYQPLVKAGMRYFIAAMASNDTETLRLLVEEVLPELRRT